MKYSIIIPTYNQLDLLKLQEAALSQQDIQDFEVIYAIDGSDDGTVNWCREDKTKRNYVHIKRDGRQYNRICNMAAKDAEGDYLLFLSGDTIPQHDMLEELDKVVAWNRMVNGLRQDVDENMKLVRPDWRLNLVETVQDEMNVTDQEQVWKYMNSNIMVIPRYVWELVGGFDEKYKGYGTVDWDLTLRLFYLTDLEFWWANLAVGYHRDTTDKKDTDGNQELFATRVDELEHTGPKRATLAEIVPHHMK